MPASKKKEQTNKERLWDSINQKAQRISDILQVFPAHAPEHWYETKYLSSSHEGTSFAVVERPIWTNLAVRLHDVKPKAVVLHLGAAVPSLMESINELWPDMITVFVIPSLTRLSWEPFILVHDWIALFEMAKGYPNMLLATEEYEESTFEVPDAASELTSVLLFPYHLPITTEEKEKSKKKKSKIVKTMISCRPRYFHNLINIIRLYGAKVESSVLHLCLRGESYVGRDYRLEIIEFAERYLGRDKVVVHDSRSRRDFLKLLETMDNFIDVQPYLYQDSTIEAMALGVRVLQPSSFDANFVPLEPLDFAEHRENNVAKRRSKFWETIRGRIDEKESSGEADKEAVPGSQPASED